MSAEMSAGAGQRGPADKSSSRAGGGSGDKRPPRPVISGLLRGQAELKCNLQPPDADDEVSLILWYKDNSMVPIYR